MSVCDCFSFKWKRTFYLLKHLSSSLMVVIMFETFMLLKVQLMVKGSFCYREAWGILPVRDLNKWTEFASHIDLSWSPDSDYRLAHHFSPMSDPSKTTSDCEDHTEHVMRDL